MRTVPLILVLLLTTSVTAQQGAPMDPVTLEQALALGPDASAGVLSARTALEAAQRAEARVAADPLSLRVDRITAENTVQNAERALAAALASNRASVASAFFDAREADTAVAVARLDAALQHQTLQAEQARLAAGAATDLDVARAQNAAQSAEAALAEATTSRTLAINTLASLIGRAVSGTSGSASPPPLEALDRYLLRAQQLNAQLVAARNAEALARAQLQATDNDFSPRAAIQEAQDAVVDAQRQVAEAQRSLDLAVRSAYANTEAASTALVNAQASDATAQQDLEAARARLDAGSISPLAFRSGQLTRQQAAQALETARHAAILKLYTLEQVVAGS